MQVKDIKSLQNIKKTMKQALLHNKVKKVNKYLAVEKHVFYIYFLFPST